MIREIGRSVTQAITPALSRSVDISSRNAQVLPCHRNGLRLGMETGDDEQSSFFDNEKQRVRKCAQSGAAHVLEHNRKLRRACAHALRQPIDCVTKTAAQPRGLGLVPILGFH